MMMRTMDSGLRHARRSGIGFSLRVKNRSAEDAAVAGRVHLLHKNRISLYIGDVAASRLPIVLGVLLTGMGADGAKGMLEMKEAGAFNIAQDESTSVVFGMPREAIQLNAVDRVLPLGHIPEALLQRLSGI